MTSSIEYWEKYAHDGCIEEPGQSWLQIGYRWREGIVQRWCGDRTTVNFSILILNPKGFAWEVWPIWQSRDSNLWTCDWPFRTFATCVTLKPFSLSSLSLPNPFPLFQAIDPYAHIWRYVARTYTRLTGTLRAISTITFIMRSYQNYHWSQGGSGKGRKRKERDWRCKRWKEV